MGLDKPLVVQYGVWASKAVRLELGDSLWEKRPVTTTISEKIPATVKLSLVTLIFALIGLPLGVLSAVNRGSFWDYLGRTIAIFGQALPSFWVGLVLILIFSVQFDLLPAAKMGGPLNYVMPTITLGWWFTAAVLRLVRSSMLTVLDEEYIKLARAKGVTRNMVVWKHAFKNASTAPLHFFGLIAGSLISGAVVTEAVFGWPGVGRLTIESVLHNDFPTLVGLTLLFSVSFVTFNLVADVLNALIDPRIKYG
jgi:peptide/nickel transport system permease protein